MNIKIFIARKHENTKTRNSIQPEKIRFLRFLCSRSASTISPPPFNLQPLKRGVAWWLICFFTYAKRLSKLHEPANSIVSVCQENIDFSTLFRYKKASTEKEEAC